MLGFNDKEVHDVLLRSGIRRKIFDKVNGANEWLCCALATAKRAIAAVKEGRKSLLASEITDEFSPIIFRPEQREAIDKTLKQFKKGNQMLWNAKMRFGKTLSALQVVKERGDFRRVLILTLNGTNVISCDERYLQENGLDIVIRYNEAITILNKVRKLHQETFEYYVSARKPFGFASTFRNFKSYPERGYLPIFANKKMGYVDSSLILQNKEWLDQYKVYISEAYGAGEEFPHQIINKPFFGDKGTCCTETYLVIGPFEHKGTAINVQNYIRTKFFRFMVLLKKNTQHATSKVYSLVPMQDFTERSDIDWNKSVPEIDRQLYAKYKLSDDEIAFIESMIKPM